jgi:phosphoribosylformylglycinamidine cyclo-ligase
MVALLEAEDVDRAVAILDGYGIRAWAAGEVTAASGAADAPEGGSVTLTGQYAGW